MSRSFFISNHEKFKIVLVLMFLGLPLAMVLISLAIVSSKAGDDKTAAIQSSTANNLPAVPRGPVQLVRFTLYDVGIYPDEARVQPGLVAILLEDLTGCSSGLIIERVDTGGRAQAGVVNRTRDRLRVRAEFPLPPGTYEVSDASRPDNRAKLIVEP